jgi:hypothetical protein
VGPIVSGYMGVKNSSPGHSVCTKISVFTEQCRLIRDTPVRMWAVAELTTFHKIS